MNSVFSLILILGVFCCVQTLWFAQKTNAGFGFPLDDPWIHLQFARNIHDYGSFSYYKNEMNTAGSTSPLYTLLLTVGFFFTSNEMILSYVLGIGALVLAVFMMYKLASVLFKNNFILATSASLLLIIEPRLQWMAISGMETTLFIALLLGVLYFFYSKKSFPFGITSGLLLWTRPDAVILFAVIAAAIFYEFKIQKHTPTQKDLTTSSVADIVWIKKSVFYAFAIAAVYFALNMYLSGSLFPNTFAAKLNYYSSSIKSNYPQNVFRFLTNGHLLIPSVFALISILSIIWDMVKRRSSIMLIPFLWSLFLFLAYWKSIPLLYQNGRYLVPLLPCFLLLSLDGLRRTNDFCLHWFHLFRKPHVSEIIMSLIVGAFVIQFGINTLRTKYEYAEMCRYINNRQVKTALWMRDNLPQNAVIATHDIGAIAFYSNRRIVDMVGLVSPEMINNIGSIDLLMKFLVRNQATHLAVLRDWFEIVNMKPLFQTDPLHPEIMEVFPFSPERTHFTPQKAAYLNDRGEYLLSLGNASYAMMIFKQSLLLDPQSARTNFLFGKTALALGDLKMAQEEFIITSQLQPDFPGIKEQLAALEKMKVR